MSKLRLFHDYFEYATECTNKAFSFEYSERPDVRNLMDLFLSSFAKLMEYPIGPILGATVVTAVIISNAFQIYQSEHNRLDNTIRDNIIDNDALPSEEVPEVAMVENRLVTIKNTVCTNTHSEKQTQLSTKITLLISAIEKRLIELNKLCNFIITHDDSFKKFRECKLREYQDIDELMAILMMTSITELNIGYERVLEKISILKYWPFHRNHYHSLLMELKQVAEYSRYDPWKLKVKKSKVLFQRHQINTEQLDESISKIKEASQRFKAIKEELQYYKYYPTVKKLTLAKSKLKSLLDDNNGIRSNADLTGTLEFHKRTLKAVAPCFPSNSFNIKDYLPRSEYAACTVTSFFIAQTLFEELPSEIQYYIVSYAISPNFPLYRKLSALPSTSFFSSTAISCGLTENEAPELSVALIKEALLEESSCVTSYILNK